MMTKNPDHKAVVGSVLRTLRAPLIRELRERPDELTLGETLFSVELALREVLELPRRSRARSLVATGPRTLAAYATTKPPVFAKGSSIQARYAGNGRWYPATVVFKRPNGYRVEWKDGTRDNVLAADVAPAASTR